MWPVPSAVGRVVVDPSTILPFVIQGDHYELADVALDILDVNFGDVPAIFFAEVQHVLLKAERRQDIKVATTETFIERLRPLVMIHGHDMPTLGTRELSRRHKLACYDTTYLELAIELGQAIATRDEKLREAANAEGVALFPPADPADTETAP